MEQAVRELEWQKTNTEDEIATLQKEVDKLKECIAAKLPPLMVCLCGFIVVCREFNLCMCSVCVCVCVSASKTGPQAAAWVLPYALQLGKKRGGEGGVRVCIYVCVCVSQVTHTRLEERTQRPSVELCRDVPQYHLVGEVGEIKESQVVLQEKLTVAE